MLILLLRLLRLIKDMASGSGILGAAIEKLTGAANYAEWKYQMENFLLLNELWKYVDESVKHNKDNAK